MLKSFYLKADNLTKPLEAHPELFRGSHTELRQRITQLREQGKASYEAWSKARSIQSEN